MTSPKAPPSSRKARGVLDDPRDRERCEDRHASSASLGDPRRPSARETTGDEQQRGGEAFQIIDLDEKGDDTSIGRRRRRERPATPGTKR